MTKLLDRLAIVAGWVFVCMALFVVMRPGNAVREQVITWVEAAHVKYIVAGSWSDLSQGVPTIGGSEHIVVEFVDYYCAYCRAFHDTASTFVVQYPSAGIAIRHAPRPGSRSARSASLAAICAAAQGWFEPMHAYLLTETAWMRHRDWDTVAVEAGVPDHDMFHACMASDVAEAKLAADSRWATRLGLRATPTFVTRRAGVHAGLVNGETLVSWLGLGTARSTNRPEAGASE